MREPIRQEPARPDAGSGSSAGSGKEQPSQGGGLKSTTKIAIIAGIIIAVAVGAAWLLG